MRSDIFWGEVAPGHHILQFYETDAALAEAMSAFTRNAINTQNSCIIIATEKHRGMLRYELTRNGYDVRLLASKNILIEADSDETLSRFILDDMPDEKRFREVVGSFLNDAKGYEGRKIRVFGDMVARLWERGNKEGAIALEDMWNRLMHREEIGLFCAYPARGMDDSSADNIGRVCSAHSKVISGRHATEPDVFYKDSC